MPIGKATIINVLYIRETKNTYNYANNGKVHIDMIEKIIPKNKQTKQKLVIINVLCYDLWLSIQSKWKKQEVRMKENR